MAYGFDELNIECVVAFMRKENPASQKVAEKIGMTQCEILRGEDRSREKLKYSIDQNQYKTNRED